MYSSYFCPYNAIYDSFLKNQYFGESHILVRFTDKPTYYKFLSGRQYTSGNHIGAIYVLKVQINHFSQLILEKKRISLFAIK